MQPIADLARRYGIIVGELQKPHGTPPTILSYMSNKIHPNNYFRRILSECGEFLAWLAARKRRRRGLNTMAPNLATKNFGRSRFPACSKGNTNPGRLRRHDGAQIPATVEIMASWNGPMNPDKSTAATDISTKTTMPVHRRQGNAPRPQRLPAPYDDSFRYLAALVRGGEITMAPYDLSALENNVTVVEILEAAETRRAPGTSRPAAPGQEFMPAAVRNRVPAGTAPRPDFREPAAG